MATIRESRLPAKRLASWWATALTLLVASAVVAVVICTIPPANQDRPVPQLDAQQVKYLADVSRGKMRWLLKYDESGRQTAKSDIARDAEAFERLILTLLPIRDEQRLALRVASYEIVIMMGNRGTSIRVGFASGDDGDDELVVEYHGRFCSGGNSAEFKVLAESLIQQSE